MLWCYLRNSAFKKDKDYHVAADLTGQANHLGVTIQADIIKQKLPENNGGFKALNTGGASYGKFDERIYTELTSDHPIDLCRYQVANCYMGRAGLINSGGESKGAGDLAKAVPTAVINKRAGGMGLISGRKAFQRPMKEGVEPAQRHSGCLPGQGSHRGLRTSSSPLSPPLSASRFRAMAATKGGTNGRNPRLRDTIPNPYRGFELDAPDSGT